MQTVSNTITEQTGVVLEYHTKNFLIVGCVGKEYNERDGDETGAYYIRVRLYLNDNHSYTEVLYQGGYETYQEGQNALMAFIPENFKTLSKRDYEKQLDQNNA